MTKAFRFITESKIRVNVCGQWQWTLITLRLTDTNAEFYIGGQMEYLCLMTNKLKNSTLNWQNTYKEDIQKKLESLDDKYDPCSIYTML